MWRVGSPLTFCKSSGSQPSWGASNAKDALQICWGAFRCTLWSLRQVWRARPPVGSRTRDSASRGDSSDGCARQNKRVVGMNVLVVDVGGTHIKVLVTGEREPRKFPSVPTLTAKQMVTWVKKVTAGWKYDAVSIGFPGPVLRNRPVAEPHHLGSGWVGFNYRAAFGCPVKLVNDAAMQGLGSYRRGKMLFLGLGTGLGSALIVDGIVEPMELGHLPYTAGTYESYVGNRALIEQGKKKWRRNVADVVARLIGAVEPDEVVLGGGNVKELEEMPPKCRAGDNHNVFEGGCRLWVQAPETRSPIPTKLTLNDQRKENDNGDSSTYRSNGQRPGVRKPGVEGTR